MTYQRNVGTARPFSFSTEQIAFLDRWDISVSDGYIGMLRAYCGNRTVWQTSAWTPIDGAMRQGQGGDKVDWDALCLSNLKACHEWVNELMGLPEADVQERLKVHIHLLS